MNRLILYHQGCPDGFCAAWLARRKWTDAECVPVTYGDPVPDVAGRDVWIVDFHYKRAVLQEMALKALSLRLIDHHETAARELEGFPGAHIVIGKSGARLFWEQIFWPAEERPHWLVNYTEDRDLWAHKLPSTHEVCAVIASYPRTFEAWDELASRNLEEVAREGAAILRFKGQLVSQAVKKAYEMTLEGHRVWVANCGIDNLYSEVAGILAENRPFGACWFEDGHKRKWSLRSHEGGVNVARIAERHGGGGHEHAAGFIESTRDPLWSAA